jgi:hypothetical protein
VTTIGELLEALPKALEDIASLQREVAAIMTTRIELNEHISALEAAVESLVEAHAAGLDLSEEDAKVTGLIEKVKAVLAPVEAVVEAVVEPHVEAAPEPETAAPPAVDSLPGSTVTAS